LFATEVTQRLGRTTPACKGKYTKASLSILGPSWLRQERRKRRENTFAHK